MIAASKTEAASLIALLSAEERCLQDLQGQTALMYACYNGNAEAALELAEFESGVINKRGDTALATAMRCKNKNCVDIMLHHELTIEINGMSMEEFAKYINYGDDLVLSANLLQSEP